MITKSTNMYIYFIYFILYNISFVQHIILSVTYISMVILRSAGNMVYVSRELVFGCVMMLGTNCSALKHRLGKVEKKMNEASVNKELNRKEAYRSAQMCLCFSCTATQVFS